MLFHDQFSADGKPQHEGSPMSSITPQNVNFILVDPQHSKTQSRAMSRAELSDRQCRLVAYK